MQGTYLMNGYLVFNVHVGINPTLTYRTVLAQKRNTHFEKIKKIFLTQIASASWTPAGRNFVIIATVLVGASDSTKIGAAAAGQAA